MKHSQRVRKEILEAGLKIWHEDPSKVSTRNIAKIVGKSHTSVFYHFPEGVKKAVAEYGVKNNDSKVIVSLMLMNDKLVDNLTDEEMQKHFDVVKSG